MNQQANSPQSNPNTQSATPPLISGASSLRASRWIIGIYLLAVSIVVVYTLIAIWPEIIDDGWKQTTTLPFVGNQKLTDDVRLLLIVVLAGAAGSCIGAQTSFATFVGNRSLVASWTWWYVLRPFIGMTLALVFYFVIRGGLLSVNSGADEMSPYGVAAVAALVGLFSKQATDKLEEVFTTLFRTEKGKGDDLRGDKAVDEAPVSQHMIPLRKIKACTMPATNEFSDILIKDLAEIVKPGITRIPILDQDNTAIGVIHQSLLFKFIAEESIELQKRQQNFNFDSATLEQLFAYGDMRTLIMETLAFIPVTATIADAKKAMEQIENCQDVFITESGSNTTTVLGWLTNIDISNLTE
jgi:hypothetical protein